MASQWCCLAVITAVVGVTLAFEFVRRVEPPCAADSQRCISIHQCATYKTRQDVLRLRPRPCGFTGLTPRICCNNGQVAKAIPIMNTPLNAHPLAEDPPYEEPVTVPPSRLSEQCGRPRSTFRPVRFRRDTISQLGMAQSHILDNSFYPREFATAVAIGGIDAIVGKWPWMVLFGRWTAAGLGGWFCGGTLITDRHVLTAAHCLTPQQANTVGVRIGDNDLNRPDEVAHQQRNISSIVRHPQYFGSQNDLAVVRLATPVELTQDVSPICLPTAGDEHLGRDVEMAGWGLLEFGGDASDILQEVALRVADPAACEAAYRRVPQFEARFPGGFQGTKVCAESRDGEPRDACRGDSGGPLMVRLDNNTYQLVGVVSAGVGCGNPEFPGLYTKVSAYIAWIVSQLT